MSKLIALDIDGTLTHEHHPIPQEVLSFLGEKQEEGWKLLFVTGRSFRHGLEMTHSLPQPYYIASQNGAALLEVPEKKVLAKNYLKREILPLLTEICKEEYTDFAVYSGPEREDRVYYRGDRHSPEQRHYLNERIQGKEEWVSVGSYDELDFEDFAAVKCLGPKSIVESVAKKMSSRLDLHVPVIRDAFSPTNFIAQGTHSSATKGQAIASLCQALQMKDATIIAAGDDYNDVTMFKAATLSIAMSTAPEDVRSIAHIIAPPASESGIIQGLKEAFSQLNV